MTAPPPPCPHPVVQQAVDGAAVSLQPHSSRSTVVVRVSSGGRSASRSASAPGCTSWLPTAARSPRRRSAPASDTCHVLHAASGPSSSSKAAGAPPVGRAVKRAQVLGEAFPGGAWRPYRGREVDDCGMEAAIRAAEAGWRQQQRRRNFHACRRTARFAHVEEGSEVLRMSGLLPIPCLLCLDSQLEHCHVDLSLTAAGLPAAPNSCRTIRLACLPRLLRLCCCGRCMRGSPGARWEGWSR